MSVFHLTERLSLAAIGFAALSTVFLVACGGAPNELEEAAVGSSDSSIAEFVTLSTRGVSFDYRPLSSPADAVATADAVVLGTMTRYLGVGEAVLTPGRPGEKYAFVEISIDRVLAGDSPLVGETIVLAQLITTMLPFDPATASVPPGHVILIVSQRDDDYYSRNYELLSNWRDGPLFWVLIDGLWFETESGDFRGVHATKQELESRWGKIGSFDALVEMLEAAGGAVAR